MSAPQLVELVGRTSRVIRAGRHWKACCPFHDEKTPSFQIFEDGHFHCFGCGAHGDAITFVRQTEGLGYLEACDRLGVEPRGGRRGRKTGTQRMPVSEPVEDEDFGTDAEVVPPFYGLPTLDLDEARAILDHRADRFFVNALDWHRADPVTRGAPGHVGVKATIGAGKTWAFTRQKSLGRFVETMKAEGRPHRVAVFVKQLELADQVETECLAEGMKAKVYRGRGADDPDQPGQKMCHDLEAVNLAHEMGEDASRSVCGTANGEQCPFFTVCGYQRQKEAVAAADVPIMTHECMVESMPPAVTHDIGTALIDEDFWQVTLKSARSFAAATLSEPPQHYPVLFPNGRQDLDATIDLVAFWQRVEDARERMPNKGFALRSAFLDVGVTAEEAFRSARMEWRRRRDKVLRPGMTRAQREKAKAEARGNRGIASRAELAKAIGHLLKGTREEVGTIECTVSADGVREFTLHTRKPIRDWINDVPIMHTSATLRPAVVRHVLDNFRMVADLRVKAPYQKCVVIPDAMSKSGLVNDSRDSQANNEARDVKRTELHDFVAALTAGLPSHVATHKAIEDLFGDIEGCQTTHFNDAFGLNSFSDVKVEILIGPTRPKPQDLRAMAIALTGAPISRKERAKPATRALTMRNGTGRPIKTLLYDHPILQELSEATTGAIFEQSIRCRGVNRPADDPVLLVLMGNIATPTVVDLVLPWKAVRPNVRDRMLARGAEIESPTYAARVYPDLFVDREGNPGSVPSARFALGSLKRPGASQIDAIRNLIGITARNAAAEAEFRPVGRGHQMSNVRLPARRSLHSFRIEMEDIFCGPVVVERLDPPLWTPTKASSSDWRAIHFGPDWAATMRSFGDEAAQHVPRGPPDG